MRVELNDKAKIKKIYKQYNLAKNPLIKDSSLQMKSLLLVFSLLICNLTYAQNQKLAAYKIANINKVIAAFKQKDIGRISKLINYPLRREYPIPEIKNEKEFKLRFKQVFDDSLVRMIGLSKTKQWSEAGWRGIMLEYGIVWIDSYDGKITAVNYQSDYEKKWRLDLIKKEKASLQSSLQQFESPLYKIKTKNYLIRIDELSGNNYRYASWKIDKSESSQPEIVLSNGQFESLGSGGNHVITFTNNNFKYLVYRNIIGEDNSPDITLEVEKDGEVILNEGGRLVKP